MSVDAASVEVPAVGQVAVGGSSPLLARPGAVAGTGPDEAIAWHYGDPMGEQRAATDSAALFDLSHRGLIAVSGPDRLTWLHTLTSQYFEKLPDGFATSGLVLSPAGHVEHHFNATGSGGAVYLDTEASAAPALLRYLQTMIFWSNVEVTPVAEKLAQLRVSGVRTGAVSSAAGFAVPAAGTASATTSGFARTLGDDVDFFVPRSELASVASSLIAAGAVPAGSWAFEALRIAARRPRLGLDIDGKTIPNELPWLESAVHMNKGCYRGQEMVARVANLGRPPRRLVLLNLDGSVDRLPDVGGAVLTAEGRAVGRVGSSAQHHELGPVALALVKRNVGSEVALLADGVDARVDPDDGVVEDVTVPVSVADRRQFTDIRRRP